MMTSVVPPCPQGVGVRSSLGVVSVDGDDEARIERAHEQLLAALTELHQATGHAEPAHRATSALVIVEVTNLAGSGLVDDRWFSWWSPDMKVSTRIGLLTMTLDSLRNGATADTDDE